MLIFDNLSDINAIYGILSKVGKSVITIGEIVMRLTMRNLSSLLLKSWKNI